MMTIYEVRITELQELAKGLIERGKYFYFRPIFGGGQIVVFDQDLNPKSEDWAWDAVCHSGSYGGKDGTLEIMGKLVDRTKTDDSVEGWLTAEEILERVDKEVKG